jgi:hypothetical protein
MTDSAVPSNAMGTGEGIAKFDPLLGIVRRRFPVEVGGKKKLRDIVKREMDKELKKDKSHGV